MGFLDHIRRCNAHDLTRFRPFLVGAERVGWVRADLVERLAGYDDVFAILPETVRLSERLTTPELRTVAIHRVVERLVADGLLAKFRREDYPVLTRWGAPPLLLIDRAAVATFGVRAFGIHVNGFFRDGPRVRMWIGRRALDKAVEPGKLDNMVAGGQPAGLELFENVLKEGEEEAGLPRALALRAKPVGAIAYCMEVERGLKPDTLFVYDLELPRDFVPQNRDGEISEFILMDLDEVAELVRSGFDFKFNVALVIIDFLIRHGGLTPDREPDYLALSSGLRARI